MNKTYDILDYGYVELQDMMPHWDTGISADTAVANAARISFLGESKGAEKDGNLIRYLMKHRHTSPFEQVEYKFRISAPLIVWWQWVRHRSFHYQSINSQSGRYTAFDERLYIPTEWRLQSTDNKQASDGALSINSEESQALFSRLEKTYRDGQEAYNLALSMGVAREQARLFLPAFASYYSWIVKVDMWNLLGFLKQRLASDAQYEIRQYAEILWKFVQNTAPVCAEAASLFYLND